MRINGLTLLGGMLLVLLSLSAQAAPDPINVQAGIVAFPDPRLSPDTYVEIPFAIHRNQMQFLADSANTGSLLGGAYADIMVYDTSGASVDSASTYFLTRAKDTTDARNNDIMIFNRLSILLPPGKYTARLTIMDAVSKNEGSFLFDKLILNPPEMDHLNFSSVEFAHLVEYADSAAEESDRLVKNGLRVIPNPMGVFSEGDTTLYIYAELYNLNYDPAKKDTFTVHYQILDNDGTTFQDYGENIRIIPGSTSVVCNVLDINGIKAGRYNLRIITKDLSNNAVDTAKAQFIVFTPAGEIPGQYVTYRNVNPYDTAGTDTRFKMIRFLLAPQQMATYQTLNDTGKVQFINQYMADRDPDPSTPENEFTINLFNRYMFSNEYFSTLPGLNDGWQTDRGRVLLQYGTWDERDETLAPAYGKPWELWTYYSLQGGVVFVFQDVDGYGDYELVHSTANGEIYNSDWDRIVEDFTPSTYK